MKEEEYLQHTFEVGSCDMDIWGFMKPATILSLCQESAYMHSTRMGFGYDRLHEIGAAWVLSRAKCLIHRLPKWGEKITLRTWHKGQSGLFSLRDYQFMDESGAEIITVTTSWLIINLATRRITRVDRIFSADDPFKLHEYNCDAIAHPAERLEMPTAQISLGEHHVRYSDLDVNQHVNNARYMEWACDNTEQLMDPNSRLTSFCINFNHEAKYGEIVEIKGVNDLSKSLVEGSIQGRSIFCAELCYCAS